MSALNQNEIKLQNSAFTYEISQEQIVQYQSERSARRKLRYKQAQIITTMILQQCNYHSNLFDIQIRFDKYNKQQSEKLRLHSEISSILQQSVSDFGQQRQSINPYESIISGETNKNPIRKKSQYFWELKRERKDTHQLLSTSITLFEETLKKLCEKQYIVQSHKAQLTQAIQKYFIYVQDLQEQLPYRKHTITADNYTTNDQQHYFTSLFRQKIPILEAQQEQLQNERDQLKISQEAIVNADTLLIEQQKQYDQLQEYKSQLLMVKEQLLSQIQTIKEKKNYMYFEQQNMLLQSKTQKQLKVMKARFSPQYQLIDVSPLVQVISACKLLQMNKSKINPSILALSQYQGESNDQTLAFSNALEFHSQLSEEQQTQLIQAQSQYELKLQTLNQQYSQIRSLNNQQKEATKKEIQINELFCKNHEEAQQRLDKVSADIIALKQQVDEYDLQDAQLTNHIQVQNDKIQWIQKQVKKSFKMH